MRRAEELDPNAPGVQSLIRLAVSGQQQELRRKEIEILNSEIQDALDGEDYLTAIRKAEEGLARFPQERSLVNLKARAEDHLQLEERKRDAKTELAVTRELFQPEHHQEARERLERLKMQLGPKALLQAQFMNESKNCMAGRWSVRGLKRWKSRPKSAILTRWY